MAIPAGVIFMWVGAHADIPAGWSRETTLDGLYTKGTADGVNPNVTGGAATHTHTSPAHDHAMGNHVHVMDIAAAGNDGSASSETGLCAANQHDHTNYNSGNPNNVVVGTTAATYAAMANDPPNYEVIFIKPDAPVAGLANLAVGFSETNDLLGFTFCNGTGSPDLRNLYLKGAAALGDAGGTGGTYTNTHTITHAHTQSHGHIAATSGGATTGRQETSGTGCVAKSHTHSVALPANTTATGDTVLSLVTTETVEPSYCKLVPIQNNTGSARQVKGLIGMWLGTLANIPSGWAEVAGMREYYVKCANTADEFSNTGGSNTHTHANQAHLHSNIDHGHTFTTNLTHASAYDNKDPDFSAQDSTAVHAGATIPNTNYALSSNNTEANSSSNEPSYRTVAFIKLEKIGGATFLENFM
jgi:hypothetical protein